MKEKVLLIASAALAWTMVDAAPLAPAQVATPLENVTLLGTAGRKMDALFAARALGARARGKFFNEAVNAFRTQWDDTHAPGKGDWQGEYWGKTMLGMAEAVRAYGDDDLRAFVGRKARELIRTFQHPDGYLGTYRDARFVGALPPAKPWSVWTCNLWNRKYTIWGLLEAFRVTGDREILVGACRSMDHWIALLDELKVETRLTGSFTGLMSMSILKPLLGLWEETQDARYLDYARRLVASWDQPGGFRAETMPNLVANAFTDVPVADWYPDPIAWAKAYEMMSCVEGLVEYARVTGDARVLEATRRIRQKLADGELNAMGSVGHFDKFVNAARRPLGMSEPCDVVHWMRVNRALYLLTGDAACFDALEFCFVNAFLASVYRDGEWGAHAIRAEGRRHRACPRQSGMLYHQCCIDNAPRGFADFASVAVTQDAAGRVCVNTYLDAVASVGGVAVAVAGNYPVSDTVTVHVDPTGPCRLRLRVPGWCRKMTVAGQAVPAGAAWHEIDVTRERTYVVTFEMPVEIVRRDIPDFVPSADGGGADARRYAKWALGYMSPSDSPEMAGLVRGQAFANLRRGPLMLAKCRLAGATEAETLGNATINREDGWRCTLAPLFGCGTWGAWRATFSNGTRTFAVNVSDYATAADFDDATNWFSLNF